MIETEKRNCSKCHMDLPITHFNTKRSGEYLKRCIKCNEDSKRLTRCEHCSNKSKCKICKGTSVCVHGTLKWTCKNCKGVSVCEHDQIRIRCKICKGSQICIHNIIKSNCKECPEEGGSVCIHKRIRSQCRDCEGSSYCIHNRQRRTCKECDFAGYLARKVSNCVRGVLRESKSLRSLEYLDTNITSYREYLESKFQEGMSWDNYGTIEGIRCWHIDHIVPIMYQAEPGVKPSLEEIEERLHYTNTQPMWADENMSKGNRFIG